MSSTTLHGTIVPLITPLTAEARLDRPAMSRHIERLLKAGVNGLLVLGTTGESMALPEEVRQDAIEATVEAVNHQIPVVVGIGGVCYETIVRFADIAEIAGADYVALLPPPFFPLNDEEIQDFYLNTLERAPLPLVLYNIPQFTSNEVSAAVVASLADQPNVVGLKDSSGDMDYFTTILDHYHSETFTVFIGDELNLHVALKHGADGMVPSTANVHPELFVELQKNADAGNWGETERLQRRIQELIAPQRAQTWLAMIRWLKSELADQQICEEHLASLFRTHPAKMPS